MNKQIPISKHHKVAVVGPNNERFFRYGEPGGWAKDLSQEAHDRMALKLDHIYREAQELVDGEDAFR